MRGVNGQTDGRTDGKSDIERWVPYLKNSKGTGPNGIPTNNFKIIKNSILIPLPTLINKSFVN